MEYLSTPKKKKVAKLNCESNIRNQIELWIEWIITCLKPVEYAIVHISCLYKADISNVYIMNIVLLSYGVWFMFAS